MKYIVNNRINFDNKDYEVDTEIVLDAETASPLLKLGAISELTDKAKSPAPEGDAKISAVKAAIESLDKADTHLFAKDGVTPKVEAIAAVTGWPVSAAEREAALALKTE